MGQRNACQRTSDALMYIHGERSHRGAPYLDDLIRVSPPDIADEGYELPATWSCLPIQKRPCYPEETLSPIYH